MYNYDQTFYAHINPGATAAAEAVGAVVARHFPVRSVADFGCGQGAWLAVWKRLGAITTVGVDGDYVSRERLLIPPGEFRAHDLARPIDLGASFDLVQSLEVAEHLPPEAAGTFVDTLVAHGRVILFSAAPPGQGGENHVNERPYAYWRDLFAARGYALLDLVRPALAGRAEVPSWYRYNTFLYVERATVAARASELGAWRVADGAGIPDVSPPLHRLRKALLGPVPRPLVTWLARVKTRVARAAGRG